MAESAAAQKSENWHEAAQLFPLLSEEELNELAVDIEANGLLNPVVLLEGKVLDGRNRVVACRMAGVSPTFTDWKGSGSPTSWVISQNLHRRHLTASQKAVIALEAEPLFAAEAKERQRTSTGGANPQLRSKLTEAGTKGKTVEHVAQSVGVSSGYVAEVKKIAAKDPSLLPQIKAGTMTIPQAQKKLGFNHRTAPSGRNQEREAAASELNQENLFPEYETKILPAVVNTTLDGIGFSVTFGNLSSEAVRQLAQSLLQRPTPKGVLDLVEINKSHFEAIFDNLPAKAVQERIAKLAEILNKQFGGT
ncbi:MAG: ParB N-terminal domain-containing protein [Terriglobales bacterium]